MTERINNPSLRLPQDSIAKTRGEGETKIIVLRRKSKIAETVGEPDPNDPQARPKFAL